MSRPRIRTIKPELAQDDDLGPLTRDARYTFIGLITLADDEGRLRAQPSIVIGHWFAYDQDATPRRLTRWLDELEGCGRILRYEHAGKPYIAIRHFRRHQQINKPTLSKLPAPPDAAVVAENAIQTGNGTVELPESSRSVPVAGREDSQPSRARGRNGTERNGVPPVAPQGAPRTEEVSFEEWLAHHEQVTGHPPPKQGTKGRAAVAESFRARRAEGITVEQLKLATIGAHGDPYRAENGYDIAESVLRPTKVAGLIAKGKLRERAGDNGASTTDRLAEAYR